MLELPPSSWDNLRKTPLASHWQKISPIQEACLTCVHPATPRTHSRKDWKHSRQCFCTQGQGRRKTSDKPLRMLMNTAAIHGKFIYCLIKTWYIETWICKSPGGFVSSPRSCRKQKSSTASCKAPMHWALMAAGNDANPNSLAYCGAAQWDLGQETKKFKLLFSKGKKPRSPTASAKMIFLPALDQTQRERLVTPIRTEHEQESL